ncbi:hypothetical protein Adt_05113 [Abeliophyllum distichum]|uniref:Uncharacterized protein n=1 Tax=Abeliophyllum distichum TaxID=126358 RepID=A0ABD1V365_9LAMI
MAVTSPGRRCKEGFFAPCPIGSSILLKFLIKDGIKNQCSNDQVFPFKCLIFTSYQWGTLDTIEEVGPSSLCKKFSNGTSTIDIDNRCFDDPNSNDDAESHLPKVSTTVFEQYGLICH